MAFGPEIFSRQKTKNQYRSKKLFPHSENSPAKWLQESQGCQMVYFQTKNPNLSKFGRALEWKILVYFMVIWSILWPFDIFMAIW
jgi:hypothetical protein